jgi:hypothetical protein
MREEGEERRKNKNVFTENLTFYSVELDENVDINKFW